MNPNQPSKENASYTLSLALLVGLAFILPSTMALIANTSTSNSLNNTASVVTSLPVLATAPISGPLRCPTGNNCRGQSSFSSDVSVYIDGMPNLTLGYDPVAKQSILTANFNVDVNGGKNGVTILQYASVNFINQNQLVTYANSYTNYPLVASPGQQIALGKDSFGDPVFVIAPGQKVVFKARATIYPSQIPGGVYRATVSDLTGISSSTAQPWYSISVAPNQTNQVTIVGETGPYISSISPYQANVGDRVTLFGQRFNGSLIYIDGALLSSFGTTSAVTASVDGTSLSFVVPQLSAGWHIVTVASSTGGISNGAGLNVLSQVSTSTLTTISASLDPISPVSSSVQISTTAITPNVPLAVFDVQSQNGSATLSSLTLNLALSSKTIPTSGLTIATLFNNLQIKVGGVTYNANTANGSSVTFSNLNIPLAMNSNVSITLYATIAQDTNNALDGDSAVAVMVPNPAYIVAVDSKNNPVQINNNGLISGNRITFNGSNATISNFSTVTSTVTCATGGIANVSTGPLCSQQFSFGYSISASNNPIYISKTYASSTMAAITGTLSVSNINFTDNDTTGDGSNYFYIAPGQTKTFTSTDLFKGYQHTTSGTYGITGVYYGQSAGNMGNAVLSVPNSSLQAVVSF